ncbi:MAG: hypothetical protein H0U05_09205 [Actinobacteria bacterium]|nr:hypothetical protein [Actinomycetota bacterium]
MARDRNPLAQISIAQIPEGVRFAAAGSVEREEETMKVIDYISLRLASIL